MGIPIKHTIRDGDTLSKIARKHGLSLSDLQKFNAGLDPTKLQIGEEINLASPEQLNKTITVTEGDTLSGLAKRHGISVSQLQQANGIEPNDHMIRIGQKLILPEQATQPSANNAAFNAARAEIAQPPPRPATFNQASNPPPQAIQEILKKHGIPGYTNDHYEELVAHKKLRENGPLSRMSLSAEIKPYKDGLDAEGNQLYSVGYGHQLLPEDNIKSDQAITVQRAEDLLRNDLIRKMDAAAEQLAQLPAHAQTPDMLNALVGVNYQLGTGWHTIHQNTWSLMIQGKFEAAALEAADSQWNDETPVRVADFQEALRGVDKAPKHEHQFASIPGPGTS